MGREVRRVPSDWQHPKQGRCSDDNYRPLDGRSVAEAQREWDEGLALWVRGLLDDHEGGTKPHEERPDIYGWAEWTGGRPAIEDYMPDWPIEQRTHLMMYETVTEGTPVSPAFATPEELARWLADNGDGSRTTGGASYDQWLAVCRGGWAPSMVLDSKGLRSGVEAMADMTAEKER